MPRKKKRVQHEAQPRNQHTFHKAKLEAREKDRKAKLAEKRKQAKEKRDKLSPPIPDNLPKHKLKKPIQEVIQVIPGSQEARAVEAIKVDKKPSKPASTEKAGGLSISFSQEIEDGDEVLPKHHSALPYDPEPIPKLQAENPDPNSRKGRRTKDSRNPIHKTRSSVDMEKMLAVVADLDRKGWTQTEIAKKVGVSQGMVCQYRKKIKERYQELIVHDRSVQVEHSVLQINDVMKEAWEALQLSKVAEITTVSTEVNDALNDLRSLSEDDSDSPNPRHRQHKRKKDNAKLKKAALTLAKVVTTKRGRLPGVEYMNTILACIWKIAVIRGLVNKQDDKDKQVVDVNADWWKHLPGMQETPEYNAVQNRLDFMIENKGAPGIGETLNNPMPTSNHKVSEGQTTNRDPGRPDSSNPFGQSNNKNGNTSNTSYTKQDGRLEGPVSTDTISFPQRDGEDIEDADYVLKNDVDPNDRPVKDPNTRRPSPLEEEND